MGLPVCQVGSHKDRLLNMVGRSALRLNGGCTCDCLVRRNQKWLFFSPIRDLCFGRHSCSKYLLGTTAKNLLCCWNLLTCSCKTDFMSMIYMQWFKYSPYIFLTLLLSLCPSSPVPCPLWQWSGAPPWTSACCWLTPSLRTWLPSAVRLEALTVRFTPCTHRWQVTSESELSCRKLYLETHFIHLHM